MINGEKLRKARVTAGYTMDRVCELTGIQSVGTLSSIETGKTTNPHPNTVMQLVQLFGEGILD